MNKQQILDALKRLVGQADVERVIKEVDEWDGSASNYSTTEAYCDASLINLNAAAGNEDTEDWVQSLCKLPVREEGDASNVFVAQAVFAAAGGRGISAVTRPDDVPETSFNAQVRQAANQIIGAYEEMDRVAPANVWDAAGKEPPEEERALSSGNLYDQTYKLVSQVNPMGYAWIHDIFHSEEGMSVVWSDEGVLYSAPLNIDGDDMVSLGEPVQVKQEFTPVGRTVVRQQDDGQWRWFSRSAVSVLNRVGEIDSTALFDSFVEHAEQTGEYPTRQFNHLMGEQWTTGQCDWLGREGNVLLTSGLYNDSELAQIEVKARRSNPDHWGDSIHFKPVGEDALEILSISDGITVPVYRSGRLIEITTLPENEAASWFTSGIVQRGESMDQRQFDGLVKMLQDAGHEDAEERAKAFVSEFAGELNRQIEDAGLIARSTEQLPEVRDGEEPLEIGDDVISEVARVALESDVFTVHREAIEAVGGDIEALTARLDELVQLVTAQQETIDLLTADDDEKRQRYQDDMPAPKTKVLYRPRVARQPQDDDGPTQNAAERAQSALRGG